MGGAPRLVKRGVGSRYSSTQPSTTGRFGVLRPSDSVFLPAASRVGRTLAARPTRASVSSPRRTSPAARDLPSGSDGPLPAPPRRSLGARRKRAVEAKARALRRDPLLRLRLLTITDAALERYVGAAEDFYTWCSEHRLLDMRRATWRRKVPAVLSYLAQMEAERRPLPDGKAVVFGLQKLEADGDRAPLKAAKEALAGWAKKAPPRMRRPVPEELVSLLSQDLLSGGNRAPTAARVFAAAANMLLLDTYVRPGALLELTPGHLARPAPRLGGMYARFWSLVLAPQESGKFTKTGEQDDSVLVGDRGRSWLGDMLNLLSSIAGDPQALLFPISLNQYETLLRQSSTRLNLPMGMLTPHVIRHTGASADKFKRRRTLRQIKKRGTWRADKSVARYEKEGLILFSAKELSPSIQSAAHKAHSAVPGLLLEHLRRLASP